VDSGSDRAGAVEVSIVAVALADDAAIVAQIVDLINGVYAEAESGLWRPGARRTNADDIADRIRAQEIATARLDDRLVGAIRIRRIADDLGEFGMLVASPEHRGIGIGRTLVAFAEDWARQQGLGRMQLELLAPQAWTHPFKEHLRGWYTRIGYRQVRVGDLAELYPELHLRLATPCELAIHHKHL